MNEQLTVWVVRHTDEQNRPLYLFANGDLAQLYASGFGEGADVYQEPVLDTAGAWRLIHHTYHPEGETI